MPSRAQSPPVTPSDCDCVGVLVMYLQKLARLASTFGHVQSGFESHCLLLADATRSLPHTVQQPMHRSPAEISAGGVLIGHAPRHRSGH